MNREAPHFKVEFPHRNDEEWLKTTIAQYSLEEPQITYEPVDIRLVKPHKRDYSHAGKVIPNLENIPENILLPI